MKNRWNKIKYFVSILVLSLAFLSSSSRAAEDSFSKWDESTPAYPFYSKGLIRQCGDCDTFVVIVSTTAVSPLLSQQFKKLSERLASNETNEGVVINRDELVMQASALTLLRCPLPDPGDVNVAYFAARTIPDCVKMPFRSEAELRETLERIYGYLGDNQVVIAQLKQLQNFRATADFIARGKVAIGQVAPYIDHLLKLAINLSNVPK